MKDYPYASGDLLERRNTYFYTPYEGVDFLYAWRRQRYETSSTKAMLIGATSEKTPTGQLISDLISSLSRGKSEVYEWLQIDKLLQRFEVTKRLHDEYSSSWRPVDPTCFHNVDIYLCFAELMDLAYQSSAKLQYLNAILKSLDTISSLVRKMDENQVNRLVRLISNERNYVENIAIKMKLTVCQGDSSK